MAPMDKYIMCYGRSNLPNTLHPFFAPTHIYFKRWFLAIWKKSRLARKKVCILPFDMVLVAVFDHEALARIFVRGTTAGLTISCPTFYHFNERLWSCAAVTRIVRHSGGTTRLSMMGTAGNK